MTEKDARQNSKVIAARVFVSCDASPLGATAIDAAVALARELDAELTGIFVEDINLFRTAALPFTHEVALSSALPKRLQAEDVRFRYVIDMQTLKDDTDAARSAVTIADPVRGEVVGG